MNTLNTFLKISPKQLSNDCHRCFFFVFVQEKKKKLEISPSSTKRWTFVLYILHEWFSSGRKKKKETLNCLKKKKKTCFSQLLIIKSQTKKNKAKNRQTKNSCKIRLKVKEKKKLSFLLKSSLDNQQKFLWSPNF